jgi:hypothetical protein
MRVTIEGPPGPDDVSPPLGRKLLWFAALSLGGLLLTGAVAYGLRFLLLG